MKRLLQNLKKSYLNRADISNFIKNIQTDRMPFKFKLCNYVSTHISNLILAFECFWCRRNRKLKVKEHPDLALLEKTKQTYERNTDVVYLMKKVRDH